MIMDKKRKITAKVSKKALIAMFLIGCLSLPVIGGIALVRFAGARSAPKEGRIVFSRWAQETQGIWVMDADGKNEKQLTTGIQDGDPAWSPNGTQIAFAHWSDPNPGIYIMNADGSGMKQLTNNMNHHSPTWSPDGKQIAFFELDWDVEQWIAKKSAIYVIDIDGANLRKLIDTTPIVIYSVDWSPDGSRLAFTRRTDRNGVWVMDADGNNAKVINDWGIYPTWSPDGRRIAFGSPRAAWGAGQGFTFDIYIMNSDGTNVKTLTEPSPAEDDYPDWSPDGTRIIFISDRHNPGSDQSDIYIMDADGSNVQRLTNTPENEYDPDWTAFSYGVEPAGKLKSTWGKIKQKLFGK